MRRPRAEYDQAAQDARRILELFPKLVQERKELQAEVSRLEADNAHYIAENDKLRAENEWLRGASS